MGTLMMTSTAFPPNGMIPSTYTCDGDDLNPPLRIEYIPPAARSLALIVDDPDAPRGMWVHWVVWNISPTTMEIAENSVPAGGVQGMNDFQKDAYGGPCPPAGTHRYFFKLYALDTTLRLGTNTDKAALEAAMQGHILAAAELIGRYHRK